MALNQTHPVAAGGWALATVGVILALGGCGGGGNAGPATFNVSAPSGAYVRQSAQYTSYPGSVSSAWSVTLPDVLAGSTIYVVGIWPNYVSNYPTMAVTDNGSNAYRLLDRYDDVTVKMLGIQGAESMGHWYAANVGAGSYTINMSPTPQTFEDWVGVVAFEVAGVSSTPLGAHILNAQTSIPPGANAVSATVTTNIPSGILIAVTFDDINVSLPTEPLAGSGFARIAHPLWNFARAPLPLGASAAAEYLILTSAGTHTATFSAQEGGSEFPDYLTCAVVFH